MPDAHALTVAIPTCNGSRHLIDSIGSILAQADLDFDFLLCDDRSDDDTVSLARLYCGDRLRIEVNSERLGLAGNWNRCVALSKTDWVAIFHQDDVMLPGHLSSHLRAIAEGPATLGLVASPASVIDSEGRPVPPSIVDPGGFEGGSRSGKVEVFPPGSFVSRLSVSNPLRCSSVTTRRSAHAAVGGFDPSYRYVVDWDFWIRVSRAFAVAWLDAEPTVAVRWHPASETHRFKRGLDDLEETSRLLAFLAAIDGLDSGSQRLADRRLARAYLNRAYEAALARDPALKRRSLVRAFRLWPAILGRIVIDPRLLARLAFG